MTTVFGRRGGLGRGGLRGGGCLSAGRGVSHAIWIGEACGVQRGWEGEEGCGCASKLGGLGGEPARPVLCCAARANE